MLADKHTISPDGLTYTITVRKRVKFHNAKVMDAKDVAYTLNPMRNQGCRSAEFKALVETVDFIPIPDGSVRAAAIERGDVDVSTDLNVEDVPRLRGKSGLVASVKPGINFDDLRFGFKKGPFGNPKLRQAVAYSIDKEEPNKAVNGGNGRPVTAGFPAGMPFHDPVHELDPYAKPDLPQAKQLMTEAGYKGQEIVLTAHLVPERIAQGAVVPMGRQRPRRRLAPRTRGGQPATDRRGSCGPRREPPGHLIARSSREARCPNPFRPRSSSTH